MTQKRNWCFTLNNPTNADQEFFNEIENGGEWTHIITYIILQEEKGVDGTVHYQGYIELKKAVRLSRMKTLFGDRYHFEARRGTQAQAIAYCKKAESRLANGFVWTYGSPKRGGTAGKFSDVVTALKNGMDIEEAEDQFTEHFVMWKDKLQDYALKIKGIRNWATDIHIYVGKSGTGKTYTAQHEDEDYYVVPWPMGGRWWWPGYTGQNTVVMDEFRHQIKLDVMLKMMDRYDWHLESKGRNFHFCSKKIIITTNIDPKDWYPHIEKSKKEPLARRIREFCTIWDFSEGVDFSWPDFVMTERTERFEFKETVGAMHHVGGYHRNF